MMADKKQEEIDLTIFKTEKSDIECNENKDNPIKSCLALKRLITALKYYSLLNVISNNNDKQIFLNFIKCIYKSFLDDYNHLIRKHDKQLQQINQLLIKHKLFASCNILKCQFTARHHKERDDDGNKNAFDAQFEFFKKTMDSLHFYLLHLFHVGLRAMKNNENGKEEEEEEIKKEEDDDDSISNNYDKEFSRIVKKVNDGRNISDSFNRFKSNHKFDISDTSTSQKGKQCIHFIFVCLTHNIYIILFL